MTLLTRIEQKIESRLQTPFLRKVMRYINPLDRIGNKKYSTFLPLLTTIFIFIGIEVANMFFFKNGGYYSMIVIISSIALIVYFSFRDAFRGGLIATIITVAYYFFIIFSRHYVGNQLDSGIQTSLFLGFVYLAIAGVIGFLKTTLDVLIGQEMNARIAAETNERRLAAIMQQLPVGVLIVEKQTRSIEGNKELKAILGRDMASSLRQDSEPSPFVFKNNLPLTMGRWPISRALSHGEVVNSEEMEYIKNDKRLYLRVSAAPIKNSRNKIIAAVSTVDDVTKEKELEKQKDNFIATASHELKTPLTSLKGFTQILEVFARRKQDEKSLQLLEKMNSQIKRLTDLIGDLLDITKMQRGKLPLNVHFYDFDNMLREVIESMQLTTEDHEIILQGNIKKRVYGDKIRTEQVIINLISNAIKYSPGGKRIIVTAKRRKNIAEIFVQDFGIGIPKKKQKSVFKQFFRVSGPGTETFPGLGLGLYIANEIIKRLQGKIWVESSEGKGSIFYMEIPIQKRKIV